MLLYTPLLLTLALPASSILINRTIDDTNGDSMTGAVPIYGELDSSLKWTGCASECEALDGTWHQGVIVDESNISMNFTGPLPFFKTY